MSVTGFLVVDKPAGVTSHDVVAAIRACTGIKKVGHTGTLDPFATGVLPLALGRSTRLIQYLDESIKVYDALVRFGSATDTGDPTGEAVREAPLPDHDRQGVEAVLATFLGERMQEPPAYSAVKVAGKPMYHYARKGQAVKAPARPIFLHALELLEYDRERLRVRITCSRGTYARVLADEIATALGSAGHLEALCRDRSGPFYLGGARLARRPDGRPRRPSHPVAPASGRPRGPAPEDPHRARRAVAPAARGRRRRRRQAHPQRRRSPGAPAWAADGRAVPRGVRARSRGDCRERSTRAEARPRRLTAPACRVTWLVRA